MPKLGSLLAALIGLRSTVIVGLPGALCPSFDPAIYVPVGLVPPKLVQPEVLFTFALFWNCRSRMLWVVNTNRS